jgi:hypothetical protein
LIDAITTLLESHRKLSDERDVPPALFLDNFWKKFTAARTMNAADFRIEAGKALPWNADPEAELLVHGDTWIVGWLSEKNDMSGLCLINVPREFIRIPE